MNPTVDQVESMAHGLPQNGYRELLRRLIRRRAEPWRNLADELGMSNGNGHRFDINLAGSAVRDDRIKAILGGARLEVKGQPKASSTRNVFIEYACRNKPSGIMVTEAEWFALPLGGDDFRDEVIIFITTERLLALAKRYGYPTKGGDDNAAEGWLLKVRELTFAVKREPSGVFSVQAAFV